MNNSGFLKLVDEVKEEIKEKLPVEVPFSVKVKELSNSRWCALYRNGTFIRSGRAIFWINEIFPSLVSEIESEDATPDELEYSIRRNLLDTMSHEMIHAIQEAVYFAENRKLIGCSYDEDEAESLGRELASGGNIASNELIQKYIKYYCT